MTHRHNPLTTPLVLDLFAGPGGWDEGVRDLGLAPLGIEWDADACATAEAAGHARQQADVRDVNPAALVEAYGPVRGLIASPPCQGFSTAGKGDGRRDAVRILAALDAVRTLTDLEALLVDLAPHMTDDKTLLALEPLRFALALTPSWLAWEQVPAVLPLWQACATVLRRLGYSVDTGLVQAEAYGVPQTRKRAILVARAPWATALLGPARLPAATHSRYHSRDCTRLDADVLPWVSMAQALGWDADTAADVEAVKSMGAGMVARHGTRPGRPADAPAFTVRANAGGTEPGGFRLALRTGQTSTVTGAGATRPYERDVAAPAPTVTGTVDRWTLRSNYGTGGDSSKRGERTVDQPAATITGKADRTRWVGPGPARKLTLAEAAVLQSFPADYPWQGKTAGSRFQQVGNAVPPVLARAVVAEVAGLTAQAEEATAA